MGLLASARKALPLNRTRGCPTDRNGPQPAGHKCICVNGTHAPTAGFGSSLEAHGKAEVKCFAGNAFFPCFGNVRLGYRRCTVAIVGKEVFSADAKLIG